MPNPEPIRVGKLLLELMRIYTLRGDIEVFVRYRTNTWGQLEEIKIHDDLPNIVYLSGGPP
jgi:hypothetical protein